MSATKKTTKVPTVKPGGKSTPKTPTKGTKKSSLSVRDYEPVSHHIYFDGNSYRVRAIRSGIKFSRSFPTKKKAFEFRKNLLSV